MEAKDTFGVRALIFSKGMTLTEFAGLVGSTPQGINHWIRRGIPGHSLYTAGDVLGMTSDELRPYSAESKRAKPDVEKALRAFLVQYRQLDETVQDDLVRRIRAAGKRIKSV